MTSRLKLLPALFLLLVAAPAGAAGSQDGAAAEEGRPTAERLGLRPGTHHVTLRGGYLTGGPVQTSRLLPPPIDGEPTSVRVDLDDAALFGFSYGYQATDRWLLEASLSLGSSQLQNSDSFDRAESENRLMQSDLTADEQTMLLDRIESRHRPHDADLSFLDLSAIYVINPDGRFMGEVGAGLGWASASVSGGTMVFEELLTSNCDPLVDPSCLVTVANEIVDPTNGAGCPADNDPCIELDAASGLSWHALAGLRFAATDRLHLRLGVKLRLSESLVDPGSSILTSETSLGLSFLFGGH